jgi:hypothetical protein
MLYRPLTLTEIEALKQNGCEAANWDLITVKEGFTTTQIHHVRFSGNVQLGLYTPFNIPEEGLRDTTIHNCTIEDHVRITKVGLLQNYIVRSHAAIEFCHTIVADDKSSFGNGVEVECINEAGGREVVIYETLTAQIAWMMAFLRQSPLFIEKLKHLISQQIANTKTDKGIIGHRTTIRSCRTIRNVKIGDNAILEGASSFVNGTIASSSDATTYIGHDVKASDFIISKGSKVDNGTILKKCFIGEGCIIDRQFSAENTLVFANSQLFNGESCSVFAAPYTVSHHKSTLLIAGYFSFINVGSGSNQSNHMYKLGPVHQGILERGCKLGSDSYILWPAKIAPYTFVMGRHYSNPDIGNFPFSYLLDDEGTSQLVPGANLRSSGTMRDAIKWPQRDIRKGSKSDIIHFGLFDPTVISKIAKGKKALEELEKQAKPETLQFNIGDVRLKKPALKRGIEVYNEAITIFTSELIINQLITDKADFQTKINHPIGISIDTWVDMAGMNCPVNQLFDLMKAVETGNIQNLSGLMKLLAHIDSNYETWQWQWMVENAETLVGIDLKKAETKNLCDLLQSYKTLINRFYPMLIKDAQKEFSERTKTGFGFDDDIVSRRDDFKAVRGTYEDNSFVTAMKAELETKLQRADQAICSFQITE